MGTCTKCPGLTQSKLVYNDVKAKCSADILSAQKPGAQLCCHKRIETAIDPRPTDDVASFSNQALSVRTFFTDEEVTEFSSF